MATTVERTSFCMTHETRRQLEDLCRRLGENKSQIITRAIDRLYFSQRFPNIPTPEKVK